ncbi:MAG: sigma-54-dependent Fis family transcriptional regulator [Gammaproteobacteria bacterium]|nr:sigma-54-dependent Fis family transcriptional regulator [Gammaproteobacteria bacterium]
MNARILVVDDEPDIRLLLKDILEDEGYIVDVAEHAMAANDIRKLSNPDLVLLDIWMPQVDGVTLLKQWKASGDDHCPVVMMSGHGTVETAVEATRYGAVDFVEKPLSMAKLLSTVKSALSGSVYGERQENRRRREEPVGNSGIIKNLKQRMLDLRGSSQPVFLTGPDGSGKSIWAEFLCETTGGLKIYDASLGIAQQAPLIASLYIEEICDLGLDQQRQLLEAIRTYKRESRFRFIVASRFSYDELKENPLLDQGVLQMWLSAISIPSLEEHIEDIPELLEYYVNWYSDHEQLPYRHFNVAAQNLLRNHHWSGDIAQLKQFVKSILTNSESEQIELHEIEQTLHQVIATSEAKAGNRMQITVDMDLDLREAREAFEREYLSHHLALSGNNMTELARRVGQERTHLYRKLKSLGLQAKKQ